MTPPPPARPHLLSACFFVLGVGTLLPWSTSVVTLPWLAAASRRAPAPPPALADSLLGALTLSFSMTNALTVVTVASTGLSQRLPLAWQVPAPLLACAAVCALAAAAARCDAGGTPLAGTLVVSLALPAALVQGALTAFLNCGVACMAASRPPRVMRAFTSGQALAGLSASTTTFLAAAAAPPGGRGSKAADDAAALSALAWHACFAFSATSATLLLCCGAFVALRRLPSLREAPEAPLADALPPCSPRRGGGNGFAADAAAPLLGAEEARSDGEEDEDDVAAAVGTNGRHVSSVAADADGPPSPAAEEAAAAVRDRARELRLYKLAVFLLYVVSLCVYPDITAWLRPAAAGRDKTPAAAAGADVALPFGLHLRGDLLVPLTFVVFNAGDLVGRLSAAALPQLRARQLLCVAGGRALLPPLLLLCNVVPPERAWLAPRLLAGHDAAPLALLAALSLSNGAATALAMTGGPACVPPRERGAAATALTACLVAGVSAGSALSVLLALVLQR